MQAKDIQALQTIIGDPERVSTKEADLEAHSVDESFHEGHEPEVVVWPESAAEVSEILKFANQRRIPVTPRSGGSSLEGNPIPIQGVHYRTLSARQGIWNSTGIGRCSFKKCSSKFKPSWKRLRSQRSVR